MRKNVKSQSLTPFQKTCLAGILGATMLGWVGAAIAVTGWAIIDTANSNYHP